MGYHGLQGRRKIHAYTWDADGNNLSVDGTAVTMMYDALDRMIEQTRGSGHTEIVYGPYGMKLALMNGQMPVNAFVKLPGGARAVYGSSGLANTSSGSWSLPAVSFPDDRRRDSKSGRSFFVGGWQSVEGKR